MSNETNSTAEFAAPGITQGAEHLHLDASTIDKIKSLVAAAGAIHQQGDAHFIITPEGYRVESITDKVRAAAPTPHRKTGTVHLTAVESFATFVCVQSTPTECFIYADVEKRTLTAVLNDNQEHEAPAGWRDYRAVYTAELSREFSTWLAKNKVTMEQEEFAIFLEDNLVDIVEPSGEMLQKVALTLQAKTEVKFSSHRRLDNGQVQLGYSEEITATAGGDGNIEIPREFAIGVRLFKNGQAYKVRARLKYRLAGGKVKFWYELDRPENAVEEAFDAYVDSARSSGFTVLMGKP
jgi:uncharacterized protein YfdQ (DUF2303 family)